MDYEGGLEKLKQLLRGTAWEHDFQVYEIRLRENLRREQLYGENEQQRSDRVQIINQLNRLAKQVNINFNDLCLGDNIPNPQPASKPNVPSTFTGSFPGKDNRGIAVHDSAKLRTTSRSFWQQHRWETIAIVGVLLAVFFASTTLYLLITRPSPAENVRKTTATTVPQLGATTIAPTSTTNLSSKNYPFTCSDRCTNKIGVVLDDIKIDSTTQTMIWDFTITNNGTCSIIWGQFSLEDSITGNTLPADKGSFTQSFPFSQKLKLPRSAIFSSIPQKGVQYSTKLEMYCDINNYHNSYTSVSFSY